MKEQFLARISQSLRQAHLPAASPDHPGSFQGYQFQADAPVAQMAESFARELGALSGYVHLLEEADSVAAVILEILQKHQASQILAWDEAGLGLPWLGEALNSAGITLTRHHLGVEGEERIADLAALDGVRVGLTGAQGGLADTGTLALVSGPGRGRLASLLPPVHIALLPRQKLYPSLPAFLAANPTAATAGSNLVLITGPSRTADIELTLSMGVHGPKEIHVIIYPG
ncbi:MAG: LUD domain-containing protein [Anaerolineales bacterium]|nr:LUD domain-containing protein [Anaerolineales bacterium]